MGSRGWGLGPTASGQSPVRVKRRGASSAGRSCREPGFRTSLLGPQNPVQSLPRCGACLWNKLAGTTEPGAELTPLRGLPVEQARWDHRTQCRAYPAAELTLRTSSLGPQNPVQSSPRCRACLCNKLAGTTESSAELTPLRSLPLEQARWDHRTQCRAHPAAGLGSFSSSN